MSHGSDRPVIGITCGIVTAQPTPRAGLSMRYAEVIEAAGGTPVLIPPMSQEALMSLIPRLDGILLPGGGDIDPRRYGEEPVKQVANVDPERDETELFLAREGLAGRLPVLGVCRGAQIINVAAGGTLIQDLPTQVRSDVRHYQTAARPESTHRVTLWDGSELAKICGAQQLSVNSFHHQAVKDLAPGLRASAWAPDGVIEGLEATGLAFVIGVQWHPEELWARHPPSFALFRRLVVEAAKRRNGGVRKGAPLRWR